ncbi:MAG: OmpH family outer membrane protein [Janthinobacterium lividum]
MSFKKMKSIIGLTLLFGVSYIFVPKKVYAQEAVSVTLEKPAALYDIAILNTDKLLHESKAAKGIQAQLEEHRLKFQEEMKKHEENFTILEKVLIDQQKSLIDQQKNLKPDEFDIKQQEFAAKRKEFDTKVAEVNQQATEKREQIERTFGQAMEKIQETILLLVRDMAVKNKYKLVVSKTFVIFREEGLEITEEILKELDQKLPAIELKFS